MFVILHSSGYAQLFFQSVISENSHLLWLESDESEQSEPKQSCPLKNYNNELENVKMPCRIEEISDLQVIQ